MIVQQSTREIVTEGIGENNTQMRIAKSDEIEGYIVKTLTENYRYPQESAIRESVN